MSRHGDEAALLASWLLGRSAHTARAYRANVVGFLDYVGKPLSTVALADLQRYADALVAEGLAPASQVRMLAAVKSLFSFAHATGYLTYNVGRGLRLPRVRARLAERIPTEEDVLTLITHEPDQRNHALLRLLYSAGLRISEACALCWRDLQPNGDGGQITVWGKGEKERTILLTAGTWRELSALRLGTMHPDDPVFRSRHGLPLSPSQAWRIVKASAKRGGLEKADIFSPHWLRHARASHAIDRGAPISLVRDGLGHASLATTSRYTHARPGDGSGRYLTL